SVEAYASDGSLLGSTSLNPDGSYVITLPGRANYRGVLLIRALDSNAASSNYRDEATGSERSLNTELRSLGAALEGSSQFQMDGSNTVVVIHVSPLTELVARQAGVAGTQSVEVADVRQAEDIVAQAFGLSGIPLSATGVQVTNGAEFNATDGLSPGEKLGLALAKLSGMDYINGGAIALTLQQLAAGLSASGLTPAAADLLDQGRLAVLGFLKEEGNPFRSDLGDPDVDTILNRQLLGDVEIISQVADPQGRLTVTGTALPGSLVTITFPDGSQVSIASDGMGHFQATSEASQEGVSQPLQIRGSDAVGAPVVVIPSQPSPAFRRSGLLPSSDTGSSNSDTNTSDTFPRFDIGPLTPGLAPQLLIDGAVVPATLSGPDANGNYALTPSNALPDGTYTAAIRYSDAAGNISAERLPLSLTIDTTAPSAPGTAPDLLPSSDLGTSDSDNLTADTTPSFDIGPVAAGLVPELLIDGAVVPSTLSGPDANGNFALTPNNPLTGGSHTAAIRYSDAAGNSGPAGPALPITLDTTAPTASPATAPDLLTGSDSGASNSDNLTADTTLSFAVGPVPTGLSPGLIVDGQVVGASFSGPDANGNYILTPTSPLTDGNHSIAFCFNDAAGNSGPAGPALPITIDATAPATPSTAPDLLAGSDTGRSSTDNNTSDTTPSFDIGPVPAGFIPELLIDGAVVPATLSGPDANGNYALTPSNALPDGTYTAAIRYSDAAGNVSADGPPLSLTIDTTAPSAPGTAPDLLPSSDLGTSDSDNLTADTTPSFDIGPVAAG
ncbi:MAG: Ig-like domain-containing protein, partial [Cyanobium sp.]